MGAGPNAAMSSAARARRRRRCRRWKCVFCRIAPAFESVIAQIKSGTVTYSVFALARLFLDKPERYDVQLNAAEGAVLHQLGEHGAVATDPRMLEATGVRGHEG